MRCDVNVSVQRADDETIGSGTRCEVKNLNGVRFIAGAIGMRPIPFCSLSANLPDANICVHL